MENMVLPNESVTQRSILSLRMLLLLLIPLLATVFVLWKFFLVVNVPFRLDYAEGFVFTNAIALLHGAPMYHSVASAPYIFGFYTPLYNYLGSIFLGIFGQSIAVLRTLTLFLYLATGITVGFIVKRSTKNTLAAIFAALLFCSAFIVSQWSSIARPDILGLFFIALGIAIVNVKSQKRSISIFLVAFVFSLAFFSKQNFVFAPLAYFLWLLFENRRDAWRFAGTYAALVGVGVLALHVLTHGEFTKQIFVYTGLVPYGKIYLAFRIAALTGIVSLPLIGVAVWNVVRRPKQFFSLYFLCSFVTFLMLLREVGIQNYLLEFILALVLVATTSAPWEKVKTLPVKYFYPALLVLLCFFALWSYAAFPWETKTYVTARQTVFNRETSIINRGSQILVEDPLVAYATGSTVEVDPFTFGQIVDSGRISKAAFFSNVEHGTYTYIDDYGAFNRIPGFTAIVSDHFHAIATLTYPKPVKPFDYSVYNRNTFTDVGTLYRFQPAKSNVGE